MKYLFIYFPVKKLRNINIHEIRCFLMLILSPRFKLKKPVFIYYLLYKEGLTKVDVAKALPYRVSKLINKNLAPKKTDVILNHKMVLDENDSLNLAWNRIYDPFETK